MSDALVRAVLRSELHPVLKAVAVTYAHYANNGTGLVWVSVTKIAKHWGLTRRRVQIIVRELEALELLKPRGPAVGGYNRATRYEFVAAALSRLPAMGHSEDWGKPRRDGRTFPVAQLRSKHRTFPIEEVRSPRANNCEACDTEVRSVEHTGAMQASHEHQEHQEHQENIPALRAGVRSQPDQTQNEKPGFEQFCDVRARIPGLPPLPRRERRRVGSRA